MESAAALRAGDLAGAFASLKREVRAKPRDPGLRVFLFQLFCISGEWERAVTQLSLAAQFDPLAVPMEQTYRAAIRCEILRGRVFAGDTTPTIFGQPEPWMPLLIEANRRLAGGARQAAADLRAAAFDIAPETAGTIDGTVFAWIADADPRLGPMLESIIDGKYYWVPFHRLAALEIEQPADLRDQVWMPAHFTWSNGGQCDGLIPTRYPGSADTVDPTIALARRTEWQGEGDWFTGLGQRMLLTDAGDHALQDIRHITFAVAEPALAAQQAV